MVAPTGHTDERSDRVLPLVRSVVYAIVAFLVVAVAVRYPAPNTGLVGASVAAALFSRHLQSRNRAHHRTGQE
jgi:dolichol kinase